MMLKHARKAYCWLKGYPKGSIAWWFSRCPGTIGKHTSIGSHCNIEGKVGDHCKIQNHVNIFEGVVIGNRVFVGPGVTFTNVKHPKAYLNQDYQKTIVHDHAVIGANATILPGVRIGIGAMVGAGSVVTKDVPAGGVVAGNPSSPI